MNHTRESSDGKGSISIGGAVSGSAIALGDSNAQQVRTALAEPQTAEIETLVVAIRALLEELQGPHGEVARANADIAVMQAKAAEPKRSTIAAALEMALAAGKKTTEFATMSVKLAPLVSKLGALLGGIGLAL